MADPPFLATLQAITAGRCSLADLVDATSRLGAEGQAQLAEQLFRVWLGFNRDHPQAFVAYFNSASLLTAAGDLTAATDALNQALALKPDFYPAYINLGGVLEKTGQTDGAVAQWREVVNRLESVTGSAIEHKLTALKQIGRVFIDHQQAALAEAALRQCLEIKPEQRDALEQFVALRLGQCEWPVIAPWEGMDRRTLMSGISPLSMAAYTDDPMLQLATGARYVELAVAEGPFASDIDRRDALVDATDRRLRIGYVSSDLRDHAIGYLMAEVLELHDAERFEIFAYYCGPTPQGVVHDRIRSAVAHWIDIDSLDDDAAARRIGADAIDILIDVNGLTRFARTGVFARRPAPIQVNWLGYPGSMGSPYHHYIVADAWIIPPGSERFYSERVVRLPCYQPNDRRRAIVEARPTRADFGLPDEAFVFCCFNGTQKYSRFTFDRWLEILRRVPSSVLWLLEASADINARLGDYAHAAGIDRARLIFAPKQANAFHLARYPLADLFLDTSPYGAHTTASDALWMGVPVLTVSGRSFAARVCGSLVRAAGLPEMVAADAHAYVEQAVALAHDREAMATLKARLDAGRAGCMLFDMDRLARSLEALYRDMVADYQRGALPHPDLRNVDLYHAIGVGEDHEAQESSAIADYDGLYRERLTLRNRARPVEVDARMWSGEPGGAAPPPPS